MSKAKVDYTKRIIDRHALSLTDELAFFKNLLGLIVASIDELEERVERLEENGSK